MEKLLFPDVVSVLPHIEFEPKKTQCADAPHFVTKYWMMRAFIYGEASHRGKLTAR